MGYTIGMNPYQGLYETADFQRGKGRNPGSMGRVTENGELKEYVAVKLASGVWINGTVVLVDSAGTVGAAVTASGNPAAAQATRVGVLVFATASATQTLAGTGYGFAQVFGTVKARVSGSLGTLGNALGMGAGAGALIAQAVQASASGQLQGVTVITTTSASVANGLNLISVFLQYPRFSGLPDANLA